MRMLMPSPVTLNSMRRSIWQLYSLVVCDFPEKG